MASGFVSSTWPQADFFLPFCSQNISHFSHVCVIFQISNCYDSYPAFYIFLFAMTYTVNLQMQTNSKQIQKLCQLTLLASQRAIKTLWILTLYIFYISTSVWCSHLAHDISGYNTVIHLSLTLLKRQGLCEHVSQVYVTGLHDALIIPVFTRLPFYRLWFMPHTSTTPF